MLHLRTLGGLTLEADARLVAGAAAQRGRLAVLAVLAAQAPRPISRDRLLAILWPESDEERARGALKQAIFQLRRDAGEPDLVLGSSDLQLNPAVIRTDVEEFTRAYEADELERAVSLYAGPFLDGIHLQQNPEFERWSEGQRSRLAGLFVQALERLAGEATAQGQTRIAAGWWRRATTADPLSARLNLELMKSLADTGDSSAALEHARAYAALVRTELDAAPDPSIAELERQLRSTARAPAEAPQANLLAAERPGPARSSARTGLRAGVTVSVLGVTLALLAGLALMRGDDREPVGVVVSSRTADSLGQVLALRVAQAVAEAGLPRPSVDSGPEAPSGAQLLVTLSLQSDGDSIRLRAELRDSSAAAVLTAHEARTPEAAARLESRILAEVIPRVDPALKRWAYAAAMPRNAESLRELRLGIDAIRRLPDPLHPDPDFASAATHFSAAAALDETSATPLVWTAYLAGLRDRHAIADSLLREVQQSGRRMASWDRAMVDVLKAWSAGDLAGAHDADHALMATVPGSEWALLLAWDALALGRADESVRVLRTLGPEQGWIAGPVHYWVTMHVAAHFLGDYDAELAAARQALARYPDHRGLIQAEVKALTGLGRVQEVKARCIEALSLRAAPRTSDAQPCNQAIVELWAHGHPDAARELTTRMLGMETTLPDSDRRSQELEHAVSQMEVRDFEGARRTLGELRAEELENPDYVEPMLYLAAALGDRAGVEDATRRLGRLASEGKGETRPNRLSMRQAELAALRGDKDEAVSWLARSFREGFRLRTYLHLAFSFDGMRAYPPFVALTRPVPNAGHRP